MPRESSTGGNAAYEWDFRKGAALFKLNIYTVKAHTCVLFAFHTVTFVTEKDLRPLVPT